MSTFFPEITSAAQQRDCELLAILVRRYFAGTAATVPRLDIRRLCAAADIQIRRTSLTSFGALLVKDERGRIEICAVLGPPSSNKWAEEFLLAHLVGHYFLDIQRELLNGSWQRSGVKEGEDPLARYTLGRVDARTMSTGKSQDLMADHFAAALLMPLGMVRQAAAKLGDPLAVAGFFGVAPMAARRRLSEVGVLANTPVDFLDAEARLGPTAAIEVPQSEAISSTVQAPALSDKLTQSLAQGSYSRQQASAKPEVTKPKGLDRLRALARQIDPDV